MATIKNKKSIKESYWSYAKRTKWLLILVVVGFIFRRDYRPQSIFEFLIVVTIGFFIISFIWWIAGGGKNTGKFSDFEEMVKKIVDKQDYSPGLGRRLFNDFEKISDRTKLADEIKLIEAELNTRTSMGRNMLAGRQAWGIDKNTDTRNREKKPDLNPREETYLYIKVLVYEEILKNM